MIRDIIIAIDGHSGCGKSTTSKLVAEHFNYKYFTILIYCQAPAENVQHDIIKLYLFKVHIHTNVNTNDQYINIYDQ